MFEYLGDRLSSAIKNIKGMGKITEDNIDTAIREIRTLRFLSQHDSFSFP